MSPSDDRRAEPAEPEPMAGEPAELELAVMTRRLGIDVPPDLMGGVLHGYRGLRGMAALLRRETSGA
jgi:hypothetical protein